MNKIRTGISARYLTALRAHVKAKRPVNGDRAQGLGRAALAGGLATLDMAAMHEKAVAALASSRDFPALSGDWLKRKGFFFTQALIPLEAAQRAELAASRNLRLRNEALRRSASALAEGNRELKREVARRKAGEEVIRQGKERYHRLLLESQAMQKKLRQLTHKIISAQEDERKEISRELHDEVVQTLVGINVQLSALSRGASTGADQLKEKIALTQRLVENSVNAVHRFARELRPAVLDDLGLIPALHAYSKNLAGRKKFKIHMTAFGGVEALGSGKRTVLFRVAQEALTNVARHSHATKVRMSITQVSNAIRLEINDNGQAFQVAKILLAKNPKRLGLVGMRERVEMVGGTLTIKSEAGEGTTVRAEIPFHPKKNHHD